MKRNIVVVLAQCLFLAFSYTQSRFDSFHPSLVNQDAKIREGEKLHIALTNGPLTTSSDFVYGKLVVSALGVYEMQLSRDVEIGSPMGWCKPATNLTVKVNIQKQENDRPSVTLFFKSMLSRQNELLGDNDLKHLYPVLFQTGLQVISYKSKSAEFGLALTVNMNKWLQINASLGLRELEWHQSWSGYSNNIHSEIPKNSDGWSFPLQERVSTKIFWTTGVIIVPTTDVNIIADFNVFPVVEIDNTTMLINATETISGAFGLRYDIHPLLKLEMYDRWYSSFNAVKGYHQLRVGLSSELSL